MKMDIDEISISAFKPPWPTNDARDSRQRESDLDLTNWHLGSLDASFPKAKFI